MRFDHYAEGLPDDEHLWQPAGEKGECIYLRVRRGAQPDITVLDRDDDYRRVGRIVQGNNDRLKIALAAVIDHP
jgi:hypothetical protein